MKKLFTLTIAGICALAFAATIDAATTNKFTGPTKNHVKKVYSENYEKYGSDSQVYANTAKGQKALDYTLNYVYSSNIINNSALFKKLADALDNPFKDLIPSISNESAAVGLFVYDNGKDWFKDTGFSSSAYVDWTNVADVALKVVPGRDAAMGAVSDTNAISTEGLNESESDADEEVVEIINEVGESIDKQLAKDSIEVEASIAKGGPYYIIEDGVMKECYDIVKSMHVTQIYSKTCTKTVSPLVLDMTGNGVLQASNGQHMPGHPLVNSNMVLADFYGDGFEIAMEWVGPQDGLLVAPKADGTVDMSCLFGTAGGYESGYEKLSLHDLNNDGKVSGEELNGLSVWQDANGNGIAEAGEVQTAAELGITSIALSNSADFISSFERNGKTYKMWDWWPNAVELIKISAL